tara:strand:+ start:425 stop:610 length:186 start_codon:yes stop_codon:yes gene_type:complete
MLDFIVVCTIDLNFIIIGMNRVTLNTGSDEVGIKFKIIAITLTFVLNTAVLIWYFLLSGLA